MKRIEAEKNELVLQNESGDYAIIPADKRAEVQQLLKDGCYECIDKIVSELPAMSDYANDGMVISNYEPIQAMLDEYNSPMTVDDFVYASEQTGIGIDALLAQALHESSFGTKGKGARTKNPLNWGNDDEGNLRTYNTFGEGLLTAAKGLKERFYFTTPEDFVERDFQGKYGRYASDKDYKDKYMKYINIIRNRLGYTPMTIEDSDVVTPKNADQTVINQEPVQTASLDDETVKITSVKPNMSGFLSNATPYSPKKKSVRVSDEDVQLKQILMSQGFATPGTNLDATTLKVAFIENSGRLDKFANQDLNELATKLNSI